MRPEKLLNALRARPRDPQLRLAYATWLEGQDDPRGEYLRILCDLDGLRRQTKRRRKLVERLNELGRLHGAGWIDDLKLHLFGTPPSCIRGFTLVPDELPVPGDPSFKMVWRLFCHCGHPIGAVLGYPIRRVIPDYDGPESFLSPLAFQCSACDKVTEIIDTERHGYHREVAQIEGGPGSCKARGEGRRDRFHCRQCQGTRFRVTVAFVYWEAAFDFMLDEPQIRGEDFFNVFLSYGLCADCGEVAAVTDLGKM